MAATIDAQDRLSSLGKDDEIPEDLREIAQFDTTKYAADLLGAENLEALLQRGLRHDGLMYLLRQVMAIHQGGGRSPNRAARRRGGRSNSGTSSRTGR